MKVFLYHRNYITGSVIKIELLIRSYVISKYVPRSVVLSQLHQII